MTCAACTSQARRLEGPTQEALLPVHSPFSSVMCHWFCTSISMATAYGDSWTNMIQPFWTLAFFAIIGAGVRLQARDIMGYTFVALLWSGVVFALSVSFLPI